MTKKQFQYPPPPTHRVMCDGKEVTDLETVYGAFYSKEHKLWWQRSGENLFITYSKKRLNLYLVEIEPAFKPCGEGDNICNCKSSEECGYRGIAEFQAGEIEKGNMVSIGEKTPPKEQEGEKERYDACPELTKALNQIPEPLTQEKRNYLIGNGNIEPETPPEKRAFVNVYSDGSAIRLMGEEFPTREEAKANKGRGDAFKYVETIQIIRRERE